jgi:hypothetical protein
MGVDYRLGGRVDPFGEALVLEVDCDVCFRFFVFNLFGLGNS